MTSLTPLRASPPPPSHGAAESFSLSEPTCCVVQLAHQPLGVIHQVVLDPAKVKGDLIRLGEWPGDEAHGWQLIANVVVVVKLGRAELLEDGKTVRVTPLMAGDTEIDHAID